MGALAFLCFFLSGGSSLVLEMVWSRELTLVFGSTTLAIATVLSVFMGGLALGSFLAGRYADRLRDPLLAYALVEGAVGLYALAVPALLLLYPGVNALLYRAVGEHHVALSLLRFAATAALLLVPTTLMGSTLPLLSRLLVARRGELGAVGGRVGLLYSVNTFGAVAGTALGGFALLPGLGVRATTLAAAGTNLVLATLVLLARRAHRRGAESRAGSIAALAEAADAALTDDAPADAAPADAAPADAALTGGAHTDAALADAALPPAVATDTADSGQAQAPRAAVATHPLARRVALLAFFASGATAMVYQVLWSRALAIVIGSSVYSFTLILLAFLTGLAVGAAAAARLAARARRPLAWLAATHVGLVAAVLASQLLIDRLPAAFLALLRPAAGQLLGATVSVDDVLFDQLLLAALPVLPATLFMGAVLPLTVRALAAGLERVGRDVGDAYSLNTLGAIVGSFAAGFVVLPLLGLDRGLRVTMAASAAIAAALLLVCEAPRPLRRTAAAAIVAATVATAALLPRWDLAHFQAGLFRVSIARDIVEGGKWPVPEVLYYHDGTATTVSVERWGKHLALKNNGKVDASNGDDMPTQIMVGLMPLLFHPTALARPPRIAVIGYGSGVTVGATTQFPLGHADVVELEPEIVTAAHWFDDVNHRPDRDPRVRILAGDGRNFLTQASDRYDAIISEPSNPWITGVSNLFTRDYWRSARLRLADDGVFCQWAQLYELSPLNIKIILRTFSEVFPYTYVFSAEDLSSDVILVATNHPLDLDARRLARNFADPTLRAELARADVASPEDLLAQLLLTPDEIPAFTAGAPVNTDDNALIEFAAPRDLLGYLRYDSYLARVYGADWPYGHFEPYLVGLGDGAVRADEEARIAEALVAHGKRGAAERLLSAAERHGGGALARRAARLLSLLGQRTVEDPELPLASDADPPDVPTVPRGLASADADRFGRDYTTLEDEARHRRWAHALHAMTGWPERWLDEGGRDLRLLVGFLLYKAELEDEAIDRLKPLAADPAYVARRPALLYYLARAEYGMALYRAGVRDMRRYLDLVTVP